MLRIITPEESVDLKHSPSEEVPPGDDVEYVVGRRQLASFAFVTLVLVAICSGISYIAGRAAGANPVAAAAEQTVSRANSMPPPAPIVVSSANQPIVRAPVLAVPNPSRLASAAQPLTPPKEIDPALVGQILPGQRYIQVGAAERPVAVLLTESLRSRGLQGFIATGPVNNIYRILVGPLPLDNEYATAKATVEAMGIPAFTRQ